MNINLFEKLDKINSMDKPAEKKLDEAKCAVCNKAEKECPAGGDPDKYCQGHTKKERDAAKKEKDD